MLPLLVDKKTVVTFPIYQGVFTVQLWPTLTTMLMLCVFLALGSWQIERLEWKQNLIATMQAHLKLAPIDIRAASDQEAMDYRVVRAHGQFLYGDEFYLMATSSAGQGGYHVVTPLRLDSGDILLVDRGFIPYDLRPKGAAKGISEAFSHQAGTLSVQGILHHPTHALLQPANDPQNNIWYWLDLPLMAKHTGLPAFLPYVLDLQAQDAQSADSYPIGGQTQLELPNNHLQYALTWFGLGLVLIIIYVLQGYSPRKNLK